jgi:biotin-(acetyl-CoA carboxylase) ligase
MSAKNESASRSEKMPLDQRIRSPFATPLDLPPPFRAVALREVGDAFAHAQSVAAREGAGFLVHVGRYDLAEFALVLEPDEPLRTARRAHYAGMAALADALAALAPPEKPIEIVWPDAIWVDGGLVGGGRLGTPPVADENAPPPWLVFGASIRTVAMGVAEPGLLPLSAALEDEGFDIGLGKLVEKFARHFMTAIDAWQQDGFDHVARSYLMRLKPERGVTFAIDQNGDLLCRRDGRTERRELESALAVPSWLDPATGGPR